MNGMLADLGMPPAFRVYVRRYLFNAESMLRRKSYADLIAHLTPHQQREIAIHRSRADLLQVQHHPSSRGWTRSGACAGLEGGYCAAPFSRAATAAGQHRPAVG